MQKRQILKTDEIQMKSVETSLMIRVALAFSFFSSIWYSVVTYFINYQVS